MRGHPSLLISWWVSCLLLLSHWTSNSHMMLFAPPSPLRAFSLHASLVSSFSILVFVVPPVPTFGEGNGNQLQYSCLEDPIGRGSWQATVHGATRVRHDLATKPTVSYKNFWKTFFLVYWLGDWDGLMSVIETCFIIGYRDENNVSLRSKGFHHRMANNF